VISVTPEENMMLASGITSPTVIKPDRETRADYM
jgi:hypothetical protein